MRLVPLVCLSALLAAGDPVPPAGPVQLTATPSHVDRSTNLWFENGRQHGGGSSLTIGLLAIMPERLRVIELIDVAVVEAVADDGSPVHEHADGGSGGGGGGDAGHIDVGVILDNPPPTVRRLRTLVLAVHCRVAAETLRRTTLQPANRCIAKRMRIDGIPGGEIELENLGADSLTLGMTPALEQAIENLTFRTADGTEIDAHGWNDSHEPGWLARVVEVSLPADGIIAIDLRQGLGERRFVLRATDVPISLPDRSKEPVGVLTTEEVPSGEAPEVAPAPVPLPKPGF